MVLGWGRGVKLVGLFSRCMIDCDDERHPATGRAA